MNEMYESSLALPSVSITKGDKTAIIVGADDSVIDSIISTPGLLYGAYGNVITPSGVSALWNGVIGAAPSGSLLGAITGSDASPINSDIPVITSEGKTTIPIIPHNLAFPAAHIAFYDNNATSKTISEGDVIKKLVEITDPNKEALIASLVKGVKVSVISKPAGVASLL